MRGWWSARPKAKVWDNAPARAFEQPASGSEGPGDAATPAPVPTPGALFQTRPLEHIPVPTVAAPSTPSAPSSPSPSPSYQSPAVESTKPVKFGPTPAPAAPALDQQAEFLRLLEVVTSMCDHVIEYIEADRAERQQMMDTLSELGRIITEGAQTAVAALSAPSEPWAFARASADPGTPIDWRERVVGGSMPAGPEPHVDLVGAETDLVPGPDVESQPSGATEIAVEVRGRFGDRWVDGFEICEVMTTPSGPRYRLRRQHDGVVLPELFDAANIRHVASGRLATHEPVHPDPDATGQTSTERQATTERLRRERSMESHPSGSDPGPNGLNGSAGYWSRS